VVKNVVVIMTRIEMKSVKVQPRRAGGFMVTLPAAIARMLGIEDSEELKVFVDIENKEIIYRLT